jgi:hypothetical protein
MVVFLLIIPYAPLDESGERFPETRYKVKQHRTCFVGLHTRIGFQGDDNSLGPSLDFTEEIVGPTSPSCPATLASPHGWRTSKRRLGSTFMAFNRTRNMLNRAGLGIPGRHRLERDIRRLGGMCEAG